MDTNIMLQRDMLLDRKILYDGCLTVQKPAVKQGQRNQEIYNFYKRHCLIAILLVTSNI